MKPTRYAIRGILSLLIFIFTLSFTYGASPYYDITRGEANNIFCHSDGSNCYTGNVSYTYGGFDNINVSTSITLNGETLTEWSSINISGNKLTKVYDVVVCPESSEEDICDIVCDSDCGNDINSKFLSYNSVYIKGNITLNTTIKLNSYQSITCSNNAIISLANNANKEMINSTNTENILIDGCSFNGNKNNQVNHVLVIKLQNTSNVVIQNTIINNGAGKGIECEYGCSYGLYDNLILTENYYQGIDIDSSSDDGKNNITSNYNIISNSLIKNNHNYGIVIDGGQYNTIVNNRVENNSNAGIVIDGSIYTPEKPIYNLILNNQIVNNGADTSALGWSGEGIYIWEANYTTISDNIIHHNYHNGIYIKNSAHVKVNNNLIFNNTNMGINMNSDSGDNRTKYNIINANEIYKNNRTGIDLVRGIYNIFSNNLIYDNNQFNSTSEYGIRLAATSSFNVLSGNSIFVTNVDFGQRFNIYIPDSGMYNNTIIGNILSPPKRGQNALQNYGTGTIDIGNTK